MAKTGAITTERCHYFEFDMSRIKEFKSKKVTFPNRQRLKLIQFITDKEK